ncbi:MAG: type II secretion system protein M [Phycisphaerae bacterium]|nr:type II secretion system protein M [Phycisphaerae bacterium]
MIRMNRRERQLAVGLAVTVGVWGTWAFAIQPTQERIRTLERILPEKQTQVRDIQAKVIEYVALENQFKDLRAKMASQDPGFQLLSFLESMIARHKLAGHTTKRQDVLQPQPDYAETVVTLEMQDITPKQLIAFLTAVETADAAIWVGSLHIRKDATNDALLDCTIAIHNPRMASPSAQVAQAP